jgi:hypothetical protein
VDWILKLAAAGDEGPCVDIMEISKPDDLGDIANLRLTHMEAKQLLARSQVSIDGGRGDAGMAKQDLYDTDVDTVLDQPCRVGVAQAMRGDPHRR